MSGKVYLVGAGPGDPELMTLRAARVLQEADVILVDELVSEKSFHKTKARVVRVGKRGGCRSTPQAFIERLMIRLARRGSVVVRLKGGDPFVFGRGGEEALALRKAGIEVEVVPGITAGIGAPAQLGIPVTHRGLSRGVTFLSGHSAEHDWRALRASGTTLVIYMGVAKLRELVAGMLAAGFEVATPACVIQDATLATQTEFIGTLGSVSTCGLKSPAIIVIGEVVRLAQADANESTGRRRVG
jgi:uroporphyrin-III C-methyltransferase